MMRASLLLALVACGGPAAPVAGPTNALAPTDDFFGTWSDPDHRFELGPDISSFMTLTHCKPENNHGCNGGRGRMGKLDRAAHTARLGDETVPLRRDGNFLVTTVEGKTYRLELQPTGEALRGKTWRDETHELALAADGTYVFSSAGSPPDRGRWAIEVPALTLTSSDPDSGPMYWQVRFEGGISVMHVEWNPDMVLRLAK